MSATQRVVAVTGALGFVGRAVCAKLLEHDSQVVGLVRRAPSAPALEGLRFVETGDLRKADWPRALDGVDSIVHLAARVHVMDDHAADPLAAYREVNVAPTRALASAAASLGIRQIVYVSSIKVHGEGPTTTPYRAGDPPAPLDPYGISKLEAERALAATLRGTATRLTVVRPPLVYGPGVRANFLRLMRWIDRGLPLPLASVHNQRSLIYVGNLADLLVRCLEHDDASGRTLLASDGKDLSTPELIRAIAQTLGRPVRLIPFPLPLLRAAGSLARRQGAVERLCGSLVVDSSETRTLLGWEPPWSVRQGLESTARWYSAPEREG